MEQNELFSEIILELYRHPLNFEAIKSPTLEAQGGNPVCGDRVTLFLRIEKNRITEASFQGGGCAISTASTSLLTELIKGKTVEEVLSISPNDLFEQLGGVVQTRIKCALLSLNVLKEGLRKYVQNPSESKITGISI